MRGLLGITAGLLLTSIAGAAGIEDQLPRISTIPEHPAPGNPFELVVKGQWPDGCPVEVDSVLREERTITIRVRRDAGLICPAVVRPYELVVDPFPQGSNATAGVYRVRFEVLGLDGDNARLVAFELVPVASAAESGPRPESGYWAAEKGGDFDTSGSGIGFDFELQNRILFIAANLYREDGKSGWYIASGLVHGGAMKGELLEPQGGQPLFESYRAPREISPFARLQAEFTSASTAVFWFTQPEGPGMLDPLKLMPISVNRFSFAYSDLRSMLAGEWMIAVDGQPARLVKFDAHRYGAANLIGAMDASFRHELRCPIVQDKPETLPVRCEYYDNGVLIANLDQIGLQSLRGRASNGNAVVLFSRMD
ncbi:MAG: hypothetical protein MUE46_01950 [Xanthomonadales bacterium]|jgi:hypothetical protein|nr:hypothetical protein [Xanthomonadales bacterium]